MVLHANNVEGSQYYAPVIINEESAMNQSKCGCPPTQSPLKVSCLTEVPQDPQLSSKVDPAEANSLEVCEAEN